MSGNSPSLVLLPLLPILLDILLKNRIFPKAEASKSEPKQIARFLNFS